jgi:anti-anti-sigma factor
MLASSQDLEKGVKLIIFEASRLEFANGLELKNTLADLLSSEYELAILDFHNVVFIDSTGLGILVSLLQEAKQQGAEVVFVSLGEALNDLMSIAKMDRFVNVFPSLQEAQRHYNLGP